MSVQESVRTTGYKVLTVELPKGTTMPMHRATSDALVITQKGKAILTIQEKEYILEPGDNVMINANALHKLDITEDFTASVILEPDAEIL